MSLSSRIADLAIAIASKFNEVKTELSGKANAVHTHSWSQVTGKPTTFAPSAHTHAQGDITDLDAALSGKANAVHTHSWSQVTGKPTTFEPTAHTHAQGDITGLTDALGGKANASHSHAIADVTNLQTTLNGKAASSHTHTIANVTNLQTSLDGKASTSHSHSIADVTGLQSGLDGKSNTGHGHDWVDIIGKPTVFPPAAHSHSATDISTGTLAAARIPTATQTQAEQGTVSTGFMTPLRVKQAVDAIISSGAVITGGTTAPANNGPELQGSFYLHVDDNRVIGLYRKSGNYWEEQLWAGDALAPATIDQRGGVVRATLSDVSNGTDTEKYVTPQGLKNAFTSGALRGPQVFTGTTNPSSTSGYVIGDVFINTVTGGLWVNE